MHTYTLFYTAVSYLLVKWPSHGIRPLFSLSSTFNLVFFGQKPLFSYETWHLFVFVFERLDEYRDSNRRNQFSFNRAVDNLQGQAVPQDKTGKER
ncbi:hypothetical protein Q7C36_001591 [Tachysurus vachellii]|uniref:Uncharacterized protein n=1 Tax=Tachysurus vachellii TaxID=175792 RepID=A0AA88T9Z0_TACVA|nr:hypothetical protein Q7C36_001591 [Tachysurus vachellii]